VTEARAALYCEFRTGLEPILMNETNNAVIARLEETLR
jgi:hypothetical protein